MRRCVRCGESKPLGEFVPMRSEDGLGNRSVWTRKTCRECRQRIKLAKIRWAERREQRAREVLNEPIDIPTADRVTVLDHPRQPGTPEETPSAREMCDLMCREATKRHWAVAVDSRVNWCVRHDHAIAPDYRGETGGVCDDCLTEMAEYQRRMRRRVRQEQGERVPNEYVWHGGYRTGRGIPLSLICGEWEPVVWNG